MPIFAQFIIHLYKNAVFCTVKSDKIGQVRTSSDKFVISTFLLNISTGRNMGEIWEKYGRNMLKKSNIFDISFIYVDMDVMLYAGI